MGSNDLQAFFSGGGTNPLLLPPTAPVAFPTPASGLALGSQLYANYPEPVWKTPDGITYAVQQALWQGNYTLFVNGTSTQTWVLGGATGKIGTASVAATPNPANTSLYNSIHRQTIASQAVAANQGGIGAVNADGLQFWRGNAAGLGGFFFKCRYGIETWTGGAGGYRLFTGLSSIITSMVSADPSTVAADFIGLAFDSATPDTNIQLFTKTGGTNTKTSVGTLAPAAGLMIDLYLYAKQNDTTIYYRVDNVTAGTTLADTTINTTIPAAGTFLNAIATIGNGTLATAATISVVHLWCSSPV